MWARVMKTIRNNNGRNPRGYGLPSLVVILFFVSILIQAVIGEMVRQTTEAKAEAAFSIAKENLDTFKITSDLPNAADMPHLSAGSRYVSVSRTGGLVNVQFDDPDERASRLFDQKLRGYVNIENSQNIGTLSPSEIRREYPERILRSGDRMATNLTSDTIGNANTLRTGTGDADYTDTNRFTGIETTLIETNRFRVARLRTDKTVVENATTTNNMTANESVVSDIVNVSGGSGHGTYGSGELLVNHTSYPTLTPAQRVSRINSITLSGQLASANGLDGFNGASSSITFENLIASGVRVADLYTDTPINGVTGEPTNPDTGGGTGGTGDPGTGDPGTGGTGTGDGGTGGTGGGGTGTGGGDTGGPFVPEFLTPGETYEMCREANGTEFECQGIAYGYEPDRTSGTPPYFQCIDQGGTPLFCEYVTSGEGSSTIYDECMFDGRDEVYCILLERYEPEVYEPAKPVEPGSYTALETCTMNGREDFFCGLMSRGYAGTTQECSNQVTSGNFLENPNWFFDLQACQFVDGGGGAYDARGITGDLYQACIADGGNAYMCTGLVQPRIMLTDWNTSASAFNTCVDYGKDRKICKLLSEGFSANASQVPAYDQCVDHMGGLQEGYKYCRFVVDENIQGYDPGTVGSAYQQCIADGGGNLCAPVLPRIFYDNTQDCQADGNDLDPCLFGGLTKK